jgi:hypothetical protein
MRPRKKPKSRRQKLKEQTFDWLSKYVRFKAAIDFAKRCPSAGNEYAPCCTCSIVKNVKHAHGGHFIGRGIGGQSGVYFDVRNVNFQCKRCNAFLQGNYDEYKKFMLDKYGQEVIDELKTKDKVNSYTNVDIEALGIVYKREFEKLVEMIGFNPWK